MRLDHYLVEKNFFESRSKAQAAIKEGLVFLNGKIINKPSYEVDPQLDLKIQINSGFSNRFVSRGGIKLFNALKQTHIDVKNKVILDIGVSTGGFSDCLLQLGAEHVVGIDVGQKQLHEKLSKISNFQMLEKVNIKNLTTTLLSQNQMPTLFDMIVIDVSFISLSQVVPLLNTFLKSESYVLSLIKPQFELGPKALNKKGVVKEQSLYLELKKNIESLFISHNFKVIDYFESSIEGGDGNKEFFIYAKKD